MSELEAAMERLSAALEQAERAIGDLGAQSGAPKAAAKIKDLEKERDALAAEVERLERQVSEDAALRAEAAEAVREALGDLRSVARERQEG